MTMYNIKMPSIWFYGRTSELDVLKTNLCKINNNKSTTLALAGLPGIGKSELVVNFIDKNLSAYQHFFWFNCIDIKHEFRKCAYQFYEDGYNLFKSDLEQLIAWMKKKLSSLENCLFIFDEVESYNQIAEYIPHCTPTQKHHIIFISHSACWPNVENLIILQPLTENDAISVVKKSYEIKSKEFDSEDRLNWKILIELLDYHPLALTQAITYIQYASNIKRFNKSFETNRKKLWESERSCFNNVKNPWKNLIDSMLKFELAKDILYCFTFLNGKEIYVPILYGLHCDKEVITNALNLLRNYFIIQATDNSDIVTMPSLLQKHIQDIISNEDKEFFQHIIINLKKQFYLRLEQMCIDKVASYLKMKNPPLSITSKFFLLNDNLRRNITAQIKDNEVKEVPGRFVHK